jgi:ADP-ribosylglycohydrolase
MSPANEDRAIGAMLGLAMGDAVGFPAMYHRTIRDPWKRSILWDFAAQADAQRITKFPLPFTLGAPDAQQLGGTDDTEFAALSAVMLLECGDDPTIDDLFGQWRMHVVDHADEVWTGISERSSIVNAGLGLTPPTTGNDNPHHFDDGAVPRAVPVGIRWCDDPSRASEVAARLACITNAEDGVEAPRAMAAATAVAVSGGDVTDILEAGRAQITPDSWLGRNTEKAFAVLDEAGDGFAALPAWHDTVVNGSYTSGNVAAETLPLAFAILRATDGRLTDALGLAGMLPKVADSMPAMVGALAGAIGGAQRIPASWQHRLDTVRGLCLPFLAGRSLTALSLDLVAAQAEEARSA